jgi:nucleotide-binding universal stress UspA family protein
VLGTHGRTGIRELAMGSIAEEIFRRARCPVLCVNPHVSQKPDREAKFHHILFATDFSSESLAALPYAVSLAEEDEAQLAFLHAVGQPAAGMVGLEAVTASFEGCLKKLMPPDAERWCHAECLVEFGSPFASPAEGILKVALNSASDLIVLGVRSVYGKLGLVTHRASTTAQIAAYAACPVLTVRG